MYSVALSTVTRDCHGGPKRLAYAGVRPPKVSHASTARGSTSVDVRTRKWIDMLYCITDMRVAGVEPSPLRRLFPLIVVLLVLGAVVGIVLSGATAGFGPPAG